MGENKKLNEQENHHLSQSIDIPTGKPNYIGYSRVSTTDQNDARQVRLLETIGCSKIYCDKFSGKDMHRLGLMAVMDYVRNGDILVIESYSRLARSAIDLMSIISKLSRKGVGVISLKEKFDTTTPHGKLMLSLFASLAEFERECLLERQREGIALAQAEGRYKGKQEKEIPHLVYHKHAVDSGEMTVNEACKSLNISRSTYYRRTKDM